MDDGLFVDAIFDLSGFCFFYGFFDVSRNGSGFRVWHEAFWTEHTGEFSELWHVARSRDKDVKVDSAFFEPFQEFFVFGNISAGGFTFFRFVERSKNGDTNSFSISVRKNNSRADVLVGLSGINTEANVSFDSRIEFCRGRF